MGPSFSLHQVTIKWHLVYFLDVQHGTWHILGAQPLGIKWEHFSVDLTTHRLYLELMKERSLRGTVKEELGRGGKLDEHLSSYLHGHLCVFPEGSVNFGF